MAIEWHQSFWQYAMHWAANNIIISGDDESITKPKKQWSSQPGIIDLRPHNTDLHNGLYLFNDYVMVYSHHNENNNELCHIRCQPMYDKPQYSHCSSNIRCPTGDLEVMPHRAQGDIWQHGKAGRMDFQSHMLWMLHLVSGVTRVQFVAGCESAVRCNRSRGLLKEYSVYSKSGYYKMVIQAWIFNTNINMDSVNTAKLIISPIIKPPTLVQGCSSNLLSSSASRLLIDLMN